MRLPRVRFTVRGMIVAVGVVAILIPPPLAALLFAIGTLAIWLSLPACVVILCDAFGGRRAATAASSLIAVGGSWFLIGPPLVPTGPLLWVTAGLTALNLAGPLYLVVQLSLNQAWSGVRIA
jgi:hypothetical protein